MYKNLLKNFFEWSELEVMLHILALFFSTYAIYLFYINRQNRTINSVLLFSILFSIDILVHQNINIRNNVHPNYSLK